MTAHLVPATSNGIGPAESFAYPCPGDPDSDEPEAHEVTSLVTEGQWPPYRCADHQLHEASEHDISGFRTNEKGWPRSRAETSEAALEPAPVLRPCVHCGEPRTDDALTFLRIGGLCVAAVCRPPLDTRL